MIDELKAAGPKQIGGDAARLDRHRLQERRQLDADGRGKWNGREARLSLRHRDGAWPLGGAVSARDVNPRRSRQAENAASLFSRRLFPPGDPHGRRGGRPPVRSGRLLVLRGAVALMRAQRLVDLSDDLTRFVIVYSLVVAVVPAINDAVDAHPSPAPRASRRLLASYCGNSFRRECARNAEWKGCPVGSLSTPVATTGRVHLASTSARSRSLSAPAPALHCEPLRRLT